MKKTCLIPIVILSLSLFSNAQGASTKLNQTAGTPKANNARSEANLVVYYSLTENTDLAAKTLAEVLGADIVRLNDTQKLDMKKIYNTSEYAKIKNNIWPITYSKIDFTKYNRIFIGGPIWHGDAAPQLNSFIKKADFNGKTVVVFFTMGGSGADYAIGNISLKIKDKGGKVASSFSIACNGKTHKAISEEARQIAAKYKL